MVKTSRAAAPAAVASPVQRAAQVMGAILLLIGILGFIPGITTNYGDMSFAGHNSDAKLLGLFQTSVLHNIVHLAFGVAGLAMSRTVAAARTFLVGGGAIYLVLWLYGLVTGNNSGANFIPFNDADDWLHFLLGVVMIALGLALTRRPATRR